MWDQFHQAAHYSVGLSNHKQSCSSDVKSNTKASVTQTPRETNTDVKLFQLWTQRSSSCTAAEVPLSRPLCVHPGIWLYMLLQQKRLLPSPPPPLSIPPLQRSEVNSTTGSGRASLTSGYCCEDLVTLWVRLQLWRSWNLRTPLHREADLFKLFYSFSHFRLHQKPSETVRNRPIVSAVHRSCSSTDRKQLNRRETVTQQQVEESVSETGAEITTLIQRHPTPSAAAKLRQDDFYWSLTGNSPGPVQRHQNYQIKLQIQTLD